MIRTYTLPAVRGAGWGKVILDDSDCMIAVVSDYGNYAYRWSNVQKDFRRFLCEVSESYLYSKLIVGWDVTVKYDVGASVVALRKTLADRGDDVPPALMGIVHERALLEWADGSDMEDAYDHLVVLPVPAVMQFCSEFWPRFTRILQAELAGRAIASA